MVAESKVDVEVKTWSPGPCVPSCLSGSKQVSVCLGVDHPGVCPGQDGRSLESLG